MNGSRRPVRNDPPGWLVIVIIAVIWLLLLASFWSPWFGYAAIGLYSGSIMFFWLRGRQQTRNLRLARAPGASAGDGSLQPGRPGSRGHYRGPGSPVLREACGEGHRAVFRSGPR